MALELVHRAQIPEGPAGRQWPAVVMVHGWLGNEKVMSIFERALPRGVAMVSPRGVLAVEAGYGWYSLGADPASFDRGLQALSAFVHRLPDEYPIDPARVTLMGFSQGAAMCLALLLNEPGLVRGVAALAGFLPEPARPWAIPGRLDGQPVLIAAGTKDETVPVAQAREAAEAMRTAGASVDLREYPVGHKLNAQGVRDLREWLATVTSAQ